METVILSEYEELIKLRNFKEKFDAGKDFELPYSQTYERIRSELYSQYKEKSNDKLVRWFNVTQVQHWEDKVSVRSYLQSKMLYRDGFYEAAINLCRSICEMICYEKIDEISHPYSNFRTPDKNSPGYALLKNYLLIPKIIDKNVFEKEFIPSLVDLDPKDKDSNFIKSSYNLGADKKKYILNPRNAKKSTNQSRFIRIFTGNDIVSFETFSADMVECMDKIWVEGSTYIHVKTSENEAKEDAFRILNYAGFCLSELYHVSDIKGRSVVSAYSLFPDICTGVSYSFDVSGNEEEAKRKYFNLPSDIQWDRMKKSIGVWNGEISSGVNTINTKLVFYKKGDYIELKMTIDGRDYDMGFDFYGDYFYINLIEGERITYNYKLTFLGDNTLIVNHEHSNGVGYFNRSNG